MRQAEDVSPGDISDIVLMFLNGKEAQTVDIITLQDLIFSLSDATVATALRHIIICHWTSDANRVSELAMIMKNAIATRIRSVECYVTLVTELARRASADNHFSLLVPSLVSFLPSATRALSDLFMGLLRDVWCAPAKL
jgi:hypothetical protein